ncbi:MAG: hypothetical protein ACP5HM_04515 [Anaerolineae bacterium]
MKTRWMFGLFLGLGLLLISAQVLTAGGSPWHVIAGGGGRNTVENTTLRGTIGQAVAGEVSNTDHQLCSGFWCGAMVEYNLYLPLVLRESGS